MDDRLDEAFRRYERAFHERPDPDLVQARMNLSLLLWVDGEDPPQQVCQQLALDAQALLKDTPALE